MYVEQSVSPEQWPMADQPKLRTETVDMLAALSEVSLQPISNQDGWQTVSVITRQAWSCAYIDSELGNNMQIC